MAAALHPLAPGRSTAAWLAHSYDLSAPTYDAAFAACQTVKYQAMLPHPEIQSRLSGRVLDLGFGTGLLWDYLMTASLGWSAASLAGWIGVDCSPQMLAHAKAKGMRAVCGDAARLPFTDASFDLVLAFTSLGLVPDAIEGEVAEALRVMRPDGRLVATVLTAAGPSLGTALHRHGAQVLHRLACGQDAGWIAAK